MKIPIVPGHYRTRNGRHAWIPEPPKGVPFNPRNVIIIGWYLAVGGLEPMTWGLQGWTIWDGSVESSFDLVEKLPDDEYPEVTKGSVLASEARSQANKLTAEEHQVFSKLAQRLIEGYL